MKVSIRLAKYLSATETVFLYIDQIAAISQELNYTTVVLNNNRRYDVIEEAETVEKMIYDAENAAIKRYTLNLSSIPLQTEGN